nr:dockerin type I repeat-containing protein [Ruminococcus sp.]
MKKLLAIILTAALLMSVCGVSAANAENDQPAPTTGPWDGYYWMTGGPMISFVGGSVGNRVERLVYYRENMMMESSPIVTDNEAVPGATYDKPTNTLTLDHVKLTDNLGIYYMGDDFRLCVKGECELTKISVFNFSGKYSTSLNITGTGTLTLNKEKTYSEAIEFCGEGVSLTHFDIAPSVTVHLYASAYEDEEFPQNVVNINSTYADPAITVGGKAIPEAKSERRVETISETVNALWLENPDHVYQRGKRVISKTDPDGIYAVEEIEFNTGSGYEPRLRVTKYIQSPFDIDMPDPEFTKEHGDYIILTQEEFNAGYDYVIAPQPKKIRYTSDYRVANRGYRGVKFIKDGDPGTVYIGTPGWTIPYGDELNEINSYYLYSANWDEDEQLYVAERTAVERYKTAEELEAKGYTIVTDETSGQRVEVQYIDTNYKYENYSTEAILLIDKHGNEYGAEVLNWDSGSTQYLVKELYWHEDKGRYYSHYDVGQLYIGDPPYDSMEEIEAAGYTIVLEDQPVDYTITGSVEALPRSLYQDQASNRYFYDFDNNLYSISDDNTITYGSGKYYIGALAEGVDEDALQKVEHEELCDDFKWWIEGTEYHHIGSESTDMLIGDVDGNGEVEVRDATWIQRKLTLMDIPFTFSSDRADADGSGDITLMDATYIQRWLAHLKSNDNIGKLI